MNTNELAVQAAKNLLGEIDALYIPSDKTVTPVIQEIITWTDLANIPIISGDERGVEQGALCTVIVDYYKLGQEAGKIAINALTKQINIKDYPVETSKNNRIVININKAKKLNIVIPNEVKEAIEH